MSNDDNRVPDREGWWLFDGAPVRVVMTRVGTSPAMLCMLQPDMYPVRDVHPSHWGGRLYTQAELDEAVGETRRECAAAAEAYADSIGGGRDELTNDEVQQADGAYEAAAVMLGGDGRILAAARARIAELESERDAALAEVRVAIDMEAKSDGVIADLRAKLAAAEAERDGFDAANDRLTREHDDLIAALREPDITAAALRKARNAETQRDAALAEVARLREARPRNEWHEDMGPVLWWKLPVTEPPVVGWWNDNDVPAYATHWTPLPDVRGPSTGEPE